MKLNQFACALAASLGMIGAVQAGVVSSQSHTESGGLRTGSSLYPIGTAGSAGVGVNGVLLGVKAAVSHFDTLGYTNAYGVIDFTGKQIVADGKAPGIWPADHSGLGVWAIKKVGAQDVWFGEWDKEGAAQGSKAAGTHTVFYVGEKGNAASTLPAGTATYTVRTINNYAADSALPASTLTAEFGSRKISSAGDINFANGSIDAAKASFTAVGASVVSSGGTGGLVKGDFFGTGAAGVAGTVKFQDRNQDVAFGGTKN